MAKALKTIAIVAGVAALAIATGGAAVGIGLSLGTSVLGVSAGALLAGSALASTAAALLTKTPEAPKSQTERLTASANPRAFRATSLGSTALATDIRYVEWFGTDQERCGWIVAHASHAIAGVDEIWLDDEIAWTSAGGTRGRFAGYFFVRRLINEGTAANAFSFGSGQWNNTRRLTGCAYSLLEFKVTGNSKKAESPFASSIPTRVTVIGRGAPLYDPRRDSTVPGGSGPMRADDQSTWRYVTDDGATIGENIALQILRVLLGSRINGKLATGAGVPKRRIDLPSFITAANQCDELVNRSTGGNEPRYRGAGVLSEGDDPRATLTMLCTACCGRFRDTTGKLSLVIMHNDLAAAATDPGLGDDDVVGPFTWDPDPAVEATPNIVRGQYTDPSPASLYQQVDYPEVALPSFDGIDRVLPLDLTWVESPSQAQRVVKQGLQRKQYQRRFSAPFDITAWRYNVGDLVPFTFAPLGFARKIFRVVETDPGANPCQLVLEEENAAIYAWDRDDAAPVQAAAAITYDRSNSAIVRAIADVDAAVSAIFSDGVITHGKEKRELIRQWQALEAQFLALDTRYNILGSPADIAGARDQAYTAYQQLAAYLASLTPAWDAIALDTPVPDAALADQRWATARTKIEAFGAAITGRPGASAYSALLSNEVHQLPADVNGNVLSYDGANTSIKVLYGATDVTSSFTSAAAPGGNPQSLSITGSYPNSLALTDGFDGNEDVATFTFRLTGTGAHAGVSIDKVWSFTKSKAAANGVSPPLIRLASDKDVASYDKNDVYIGGPITFTATRQNIPGTNTYFRIIRVSDGALLNANTSEAYAAAFPPYYEGSGGDRFVMTAVAVRDYIASHGTFRIEAYRDGYSATDSVSIAKVKDGATGAGAFNLVADTAETVLPTPNSIAGTSTTGWGQAHAHSVESYVAGAVASWTVPPDALGLPRNTMAGLTQGTGSDRGNSYDSITFALHRNDAGLTGVFVNGNSYAAGPQVNPQTATRMRVLYDGLRYVRFWVNDTELLPYDWGQQADPLRFAAALASVQPRIEDISFSKAGTNGKDGVPAITGWLTNESHTLPADFAGNIQNYVGAQGVFRVNSGGADVTGTPTFYATLDNPQGLTRSGGPALIDANGFFRVDAGFDPGETSATVTLRAVYAGTTIDRTFSLARSKDGTPGQNGLNAKIMFLASSHQTISVNGDGTLVPQTTIFTANRTNPNGALTVWRMLDDDGAGRTGWMFSGDFARYLAGATAGEQVDVVSFSADILNGHISGSGRNTNGLIFEAAMHDDYAIVDRVSIARVRSGQRGNDGNPGANAATITVSASPTAVRYDKAGNIASGDIVFTAARQNAVGPIAWRSVIGHGVYGTDGVTFSGDTMTITQARMAAVLAYNAANFNKASETVVASVGSIEGSATVTAVRDGADGQPGQPGQPGASADQLGLGVLANGSLGMSIPSSGSTTFTDYSQTINVVAGRQFKLTMVALNGFRNTGGNVAVATIRVILGNQVLFNGTITVDVDGSIFSSSLEDASTKLIANNVSGSVQLVGNHSRGGPVGNAADFDFNFILARV